MIQYNPITKKVIEVDLTDKIIEAQEHFEKQNKPYKTEYNGGKRVNILKQDGKKIREYLLSDFITDYCGKTYRNINAKISIDNI